MVRARLHYQDMLDTVSIKVPGSASRKTIRVAGRRTRTPVGRSVPSQHKEAQRGRFTCGAGRPCNNHDLHQDGILEPSETEGLPSTAFILGTARHAGTGAHTVYVSLEGNDATPIAAFIRAVDAAVAQTRTEDTLHQMLSTVVDTVKNDPDKDASAAGFAVWVTFLWELDAVSDAVVKPFSAEQLARIQQGFAALKEQARAVPAAPEGFSRVLTYSPEALAGVSMPRVRLTPIQSQLRGK